jgi:FlaG/FlaF family flagellin (archaellin)
MKQRSEDAVSPVVGVMLMLVVTIIIAAVVSAFAGGIAGETRQAPTASLDVKVYSLKNLGAMPPWGEGYYTPEITIRHLSGDPLPTKDLRIVTYVRNESGVVRGELSGEVVVNGKDEWNAFNETQYSGALYLNDMNRFGGGVQNSDAGYANWFGNASAVLRPGDILVTPGNHCGNYNDNNGPDDPHENVGLNRIFGLTDGTDSYATAFAHGATATIRIIHTPSGQTIYDREVVIQ